MKSTLMINERIKFMSSPIVLIISGPSGAGKGTVVEALLKKMDFALSISATSREPRKNDIDGVNYFFYNKEDFEKMIAADEFLEYAEFCGNYYGTPRSYVDKSIKEGKDVLLEIEIQGSLQVKKKIPEAILVFLTPPSLEVLEQRLRGRNTETEEKIQLRLAKAEEELKMLDLYDYVVVNDTVEKSVEDIIEIVNAEKNKK